MGVVERKAMDFKVSEEWFSYELNSANQLRISIFEPEYENLSSEESLRLLEFSLSFSNIRSLSIDLPEYIITDTKGFENLIYLETLYINCTTHFTNLDFLEKSVNLRYLYIESSAISDIDILSNFHHLNTVVLNNSAIESIKSLENLLFLEWISFNNNKIEDISCISSLKNLKQVFLSGNKIKNIDVFFELSEVRAADFSHNSILSINSLKLNNKITTLNIAGNNITDIKIVQNFPDLKYFNFSENHISDISCISDCKELIHLVASSNRIQNIDSTKSLSNLKSLICSQNPLDESEIQFHSQLENIVMENCGLTNLRFLRNQISLKVLNINFNSVHDFSPLVIADYLQEIYVRSNGIVEAFPIHYFPEIRIVDLSENLFGNIKFVEYLGGEQGENSALILELKKMNADFYFKQGKYDEALAFYYYDLYERTDETFYIYLDKFLKIPSDEIVYIKYYFHRLNNALFNYPNRHKLIEQNYDAIYEKLESLRNPENTILLESLAKLKIGQRYIYSFSYMDFHFYQSSVSNPLINDDLLFIYGSLHVNREHFFENLYYLKELKKRNSPYYFNLFTKIKMVLKMNFAYTEIERQEHDRFNYLLHHLEDNIIQKPVVNSFERFSIDKQFHYSYYEHPNSQYKSKQTSKGREYFERFLLLFFTIAMLVSIIMAIIAFIKFISI